MKIGSRVGCGTEFWYSGAFKLGVVVNAGFEEREQLAEAIGQDTLEVWRYRRHQCLVELSEDNPAEFLRFCLSVLPSSVELDLEGGVHANG